MQKLNWMRTTARHGPKGQTLGLENARPLLTQSAQEISSLLDPMASNEQCLDADAESTHLLTRD